MTDVEVEISPDEFLGVHWSSETREYRSEFEELGSIEWRDYSYEFDLTAVFIHKASGRLFAADDAGCSCPSPFEDVQVQHATEIKTPHDFFVYLSQRCPEDPALPSAVDEQHVLVQAVYDYLITNKKAVSA